MAMAAAAPQENDLKKLEVIRVSPSCDLQIAAAEFSLPLTFYDTFWLKFHPVERLFFYRFITVDDSTPSFFTSVVLPKLKRSLALTLHHYIPLAGHISWPSHAPEPLLFTGPNDGVSFTVAESSSAHFDHLTGHGPKKNLELRPLVPQLKVHGDKSETFSLQITLFPGSGFCIGVASHHAVLDGKSSTCFMKSWSYICRQLGDQEEENNFVSLPENLTPVLDRSMIRDPLGLSGRYARLWMEFTNSSPSDPHKLKPLNNLLADPTDLVRASYVLSNENIKMLKQRVLPKLDEAKRQRLSTFAVIWSYVVVSIVGARAKDGEQTLMYGFAVDYRARLDPPLLETYFGNCVGGLAVSAKAKQLTDENGLLFAVDKTIDQIETLNYKIQDGLEDTLSANLKSIEVMMFGELSELLVVSVAGSPRFGVYGCDFGWGRPEKVEVVSIDRNAAVSLAENRDEVTGGVEVGVALKKEELEKFASLFVHGLEDRQLT